MLVRPVGHWIIGSKACSSHNKCINNNGLASNIIVVYNRNIMFFLQFVLALCSVYGISRNAVYVTTIIRAAFSSLFHVKYGYLHIPPRTVGNISANRIFICTLLAGKKTPPISLNDMVITTTYCT